MEHAAAGTGQMAYIEAHKGGLGQHRQGRVHKRCSGGLTYHAALLQFRGDWAFYNSVLDFPSWSSRHICWKCRASKGGPFDYKEAGSGAAWRAQRLEGNAFLAEQRAAGITPSTIFSAPGFQVKHIMVDYLHTMDLGVAADCLGNLFLEILRLFARNSS